MLNGIVLHRGAILWPRLPFTGLSHGNKSIFIAVNLMAIIICNMISHLKSQQMVIAHVTVVGYFILMVWTNLKLYIKTYRYPHWNLL